MEVTISVPGIFNAFRLAEHLHQKGNLHRIYATNLRSPSRDHVPDEKVRNFRLPSIIFEIGNQFHLLDHLVPSEWQRPTRQWKSTLFDRAVAKRLEKTDEPQIFVGFSGSCLRSIHRARQLGMTTIVERTSSHSRYQWEILKEEYGRYGLKPPLNEAKVEHDEREYSAADYIMTPSNFAYQSFLEQNVDEDRLFCVPFGVDVPPQTPSVNEGDEFVVLFVGHLGYRKGAQYLLQAWESLEIPNAKLELVGGIDRNFRSVINQYNDKDSIEFVGWVDDPERYYKRASVFVFPSLEEGSARVVYEAMAHGLPVVTTWNSGWVGTDSEHGLEVPIRDPDAIGNAIYNIFDNRETRKSMGKKAREHVSSQYSWEQYGNRVHECYESFI